ncbi:MAG: acyltransferase family protein [Anaerocolumna sp.]
MKTIKRNTNIELLRIISMILIIMHHYSIHGDFDFSNDLTINKIVVQLLAMGGKLGVNLFILITGYFMINSSFTLKKLIKIVLEVQFYSILFAFIFMCFGLSDFNIKELIKSIFPLIFSRYWFATNYVLLYLLSPFINKFLTSIEVDVYNRLLGVVIFIWVIIPTFTGAEFGLSNLVWFIVVYSFGAYFKLYSSKYVENNRLNLIIAFITYAMILLSVILFNLLGLKIAFFGSNATYFMAYNKLPLVVCSVTLFLGFKGMKIKNNKFINIIATSIFSVYLIHDNYFMRPFIWNSIFKNRNYQDSPLLIIHAMCTIFIVFVCCIAIDQTKKITYDKWLMKIIEKTCSV